MPNKIDKSKLGLNEIEIDKKSGKEIIVLKDFYFDEEKEDSRDITGSDDDLAETVLHQETMEELLNAKNEDLGDINLNKVVDNVGISEEPIDLIQQNVLEALLEADIQSSHLAQTKKKKKSLSIPDLVSKEKPTQIREKGLEEITHKTKKKKK